MENKLIPKQIFEDIKKEYNRALVLFPEFVDQLPALAEETGELCQAMLDQKHGKGIITNEDIYKEAIQVAVMAISIALNGDINFPYKYEKEN